MRNCLESNISLVVDYERTFNTFTIFVELFFKNNFLSLQRSKFFISGYAIKSLLELLQLYNTLLPNKRLTIQSVSGLSI